MIKTFILAPLALAALLSSSSVIPHPDPRLTPGVALPDVTAADVCQPGYASSVCNVSSSEKTSVYRRCRYGIQHHHRGEYEVDHLISLELGGSNDLRNL